LPASQQRHGEVHRVADKWGDDDVIVDRNPKRLGDINDLLGHLAIA
jgi:hypothetical protein